MPTAQSLWQQGARQAVEQERRKETEKKISVKERGTIGKPLTAVAERLQRQSSRVVEYWQNHVWQAKGEKAGKGRSKQAGGDKLSYCSSGPKYCYRIR